MRRAITLVVSLLAVAVAEGAGAADVRGTPFADVLRGTSSADRLYGQAGNDKISGLAGNDLLDGRTGNDRLDGGGGGDRLVAGPGNDRLIGGPGSDTLVGGPGADVLSCGPGRDTATADGADTIGDDCEIVHGVPKPSLSISEASTAEGNQGSTTISFEVVLAQRTNAPVTVAYRTQDDTATAPADYTAASGTIRFAAGETRRTLTVAIVGETEFEFDERFTIVLSTPVNATIGTGSATATIHNDDGKTFRGRTAQGQPISFDVAPDLHSVANLYFVLDYMCTSALGPFPVSNLPFGPLREPLALDQERRFGVAERYSEEGGSIRITLTGTISSPGAASGTFRSDLVVNTSLGTIPCTTGDVSWNAS